MNNQKEIVINRNSRGLVEDIQDVAFNLQSMADHLLDLPDEAKIEALEKIEKLNALRQETIAVYAKDMDYRYHCAYKHGLMVRGIMKEVIQIARRQNLDEWVAQLLDIDEVYKEIFNWISAKYFKIPEEDIADLADCQKCLNDILIDKQTNGFNNPD